MAHEWLMAEEYLLSRLQDKDRQIEEFQKTVRALKKELLDVHDWIADYITDEIQLFALQKLHAQILGAVRTAPELTTS